MADPSTQTLFKARLIRRGLMFCGSFFVLAVLYVASIGPLAFLESEGVATDETWNHLKQSAYYPIFYSWWHGPKWLDVTFRCYVGCFERSGDTARRFGARANHIGYLLAVFGRVHDKRDRQQLEWDIAHPVEARARKDAEMRKEHSGILWCYSRNDITEAERAEAESNWWQSFGRLE